jgi:REP element-mobilizing transposase RayT
VNSSDPEFAVQTEQKEAQPTPKILVPPSMPEADPEEGRGSRNMGENSQVGFAAPSAAELSYVCLLIPRFNDHYLVGDITECLVEWMKQICISYGWRLEAIAVRPGYLQWVISVPLNANPAQFIRIFRQQTSQRVFEDFPRFKQKNVSGQFWAPGDFVVAGNQLQTSETINGFILQTRRYQGIA